MTLEPLTPAPRSSAVAGDIGVLVAGGSALTRRGIRTILSTDARFVVLAEARTRADLLTLAAQLRPAAIVLDPDLPMGVLPALAELMASHPTPVVVYGDGCLASPASQADLRAAGAVDIVIRPPAGDGPGTQERGAQERDCGHQRGSSDGADLRACLLLASRIRVIRHPRGGLMRTAFTPATGVPLVVIGASTGGPSALGAVLSGLPADLNAAIVVVQHMPAGFLSGLAAWLDSSCLLPVSLGADGDLVCPGEVLICPGNMDSLIEVSPAPAVGRLRCTDPAPDARHVPSVDRAFTSVSAALGPRAIGVLLTGMGCDGALGMAALKAAGAATIAQDESTSAIYGMPAAAVAAGVVDRVLPLPDIASALIGLVATANAAERDARRAGQRAARRALP